jgi:hypothetical protein
VREREKRENWGEGVVVRNSKMMRVKETIFFGFEGSQAVPASPSGKGEACVRD